VLVCPQSPHRVEASFLSRHIGSHEQCAALQGITRAATSFGIIRHGHSQCALLGFHERTVIAAVVTFAIRPGDTVSVTCPSAGIWALWYSDSPRLRADSTALCWIQFHLLPGRARFPARGRVGRWWTESLLYTGWWTFLAKALVPITFTYTLNVRRYRLRLGTEKRFRVVHGRLDPGRRVRSCSPGGKRRSQVFG
jgi:hypothetical protein